MVSITSLKPHASPRLTFSALAQLMGSHTSLGHMGILRNSKYPQPGPVMSYKNGVRQIVEDMLGSGKSVASLRQHELDVLNEFRLNPLTLPRGCVAKKSAMSTSHWVHCNVEISVFPDVLVVGPKGTGAVKFHVAKEPLPRGVGSAMATLIAHHRRAILNDNTTCDAYCIVYEVRSGKSHSASAKTAASQMKSVTAACQLASAVWPSL